MHIIQPFFLWLVSASSACHWVLGIGDRYTPVPNTALGKNGLRFFKRRSDMLSIPSLP